MRKTAKAVLNRILDVDSNLVVSPTPGSVPTVIDGVHLLHAVVWNAPCLYADVIQGHVLYIKKHFPNRFVVVVFDGYSSQKLSTKVVEQSMRSSNVTSADIFVSPSKNTSTTQEEFLWNGHHKTSLITLVSEEFNAVGNMTHQAETDADNLIVSTTLEYSQIDQGVDVICKDVDDISFDRMPPGDKITLIRPQPGGLEPKCIDIGKLQASLGVLKNVILFAHAFTGTDTTSAAFRRGKAQACNLLRMKPDLRADITILYNKDASQEEIAAAGERFFLAWYGAEKFSSLNTARFF